MTFTQPYVYTILQLILQVIDALTNPYATLQPTDSATLKTVFFSGNPYVVLCHKAEYSSAEATSANADALASFRRVACALEGSGVTSAVLDCWAPLPDSGISTLSRFKLGSPTAEAVTAFTVSNLQSPRLIPASALAKNAPIARAVDHIRAGVAILKCAHGCHTSACMGARMFACSHCHEANESQFESPFTIMPRHAR